MGKGSGGAPKAPDAHETASAEAQFNRLDTYGPSGSGVVHGYTDSNGQFVQGTPPKGYQAAQKTIESPWERQIREMLQPQGVNLVNRMVSDNVTNIPNTARVGNAVSFDNIPGVAAAAKIGAPVSFDNIPGVAAAAKIGAPVSFDNIPGVAAARVKDRGEVGDTVFNRNLSMAMPGIDKANSRLLTNLQARGLPVGGAAFNDAMGEQTRQTQDTIARMAMDADIAAGQEQSRLFGLDSAARQQSVNEFLSANDLDMRRTGLQANLRQQSVNEFLSANDLDMRRTGLQADLRQQSVNEFLAAGQEQSRRFGLDSSARQQSIAEIVAAMGGSYNPPSAVPSGSAAGVNYSNLVGGQYQNQMAQYNQQQASNAQTASTLGSLGGAMIMKSDMIFKRDIVKIGQRDGHGLYQYRYVWDAIGVVRTGYMVQDVLRVLPRAVVRIGRWLFLDYAQLPQVK